MALTKAVFTRRHFIGLGDNRRVLCGGYPASLGPDPTTNPRKVTCQRCKARLASLAREVALLLGVR